MMALGGKAAPSVLPDCGTSGGYHHHRRLGETACDACKHAKKMYSREWRKDPENRKKKYEYNKAYYQRPDAKIAYVAYRRKSRYGITPEQYQAVLKAQGNGCAICGSSERLRVDHEHGNEAKTWRTVRGVLCHACNTALGYFGDDLDGCRKHRWDAGADYLLIVVPRNRAMLATFSGESA